MGAIRPARALILYDAPPGQTFTKLGFAYAIMLRNLLGHFDSQVDMVPVQNYTAGQVHNYAVTFYLGSYYDNQVPAAFMSDATTTTKTVVWFKYNLWQMAWDSQYNFQSRFGFAFSGLRGLNATPSASNQTPGFFDTTTYKSLPFVKYYDYNGGAVVADPDVGIVVTDELPRPRRWCPCPTRRPVKPHLTSCARATSMYVADLPFSYIGPRDRYLVLQDLLYDMLGVTTWKPPRPWSGWKTWVRWSRCRP